jgi:hypothetical protein
MSQQQLSPKVQKVVDELNALCLTELKQVVEIASAELATKIAGAVEHSTPASRARASAELGQGVAAATTPRKTAPVSEIKTIDDHLAVVGQITFKGQQLDTLLSEGSAWRSRESQEQLAATFGGERPYRMATRSENLAYLRDLRAKKRNRTINDAEEKALQTYRNFRVRDTKGSLIYISGEVVRMDWGKYGNGAVPDSLALFVRASAEPK